MAALIEIPRRVGEIEILPATGQSDDIDGPISARNSTERDANPPNGQTFSALGAICASTHSSAIDRVQAQGFGPSTRHFAFYTIFVMADS